MNYPLLSEYCEAVKYAADNFNELSHLTPVLDTHGNPVMSSGNFAVVFRMHDAKANKDVAVKCFLREQEGRAESYRLIAQELAYTPSPFLTPIRYLDQELFVDSKSTTDKEFPAVVMDWIAGDTLDRYVQAHLSDPNALRLLTFQFSRLASWLLSQPFAHGDLKPDNILVRPDGTLALVDYDGMFVPAMKGTSARELGSPDFRHPLRTPEYFNDHIDDFPLVSILLSLKALSLSPSLWQTYGAADRLLFSAADYCDLASCPLLRELLTLFADPELPRLYALFLLAYTEGKLNNASINLINLSVPEVVEEGKMVEEVELSTEVTQEEIEEGVKDEYGVTYSKDGLRLLKGNHNLETYTVRKGTRVICDEAFSSCYDLTSITLPQGVESIGHNPFMYCTNLSSVICHSPHFNVINKMLLTSDGKRLISYWGKEKVVIVPQGVESIGDRAFVWCEPLTSITLPQGVESIGNRAFEGCTALTSITLPQGIESIGHNPFMYCTNLSSVICHSPHFKVIDKMLLTSDGKRLISYWGKEKVVIVPQGVESIGDRAFALCETLTSIKLPQGVESIEKGAFAWCKALTSITLPQGVKSIGNGAFYECKALTSITLPQGIKSIGNKAFYECKALTSITLPQGVKSIGDEAFKSCEALTSITLPQGVESIGNFAFHICVALTSITLPQGVKSIGHNPFMYCTNLSSVICHSPHFKVIDKMLLTSDGKRLISYWGKEKVVIVPQGVESIGDRAFKSRDALTSITLPQGVERIGNEAFAWCKALTSIKLPQGVESIGDRAFALCETLTSITLPQGVERIGNEAFAWCKALTSIKLPQGVKSIGDGAFARCKALTSITLLQGVESIGNEAFSSCESLTSITLPQGVKSIGNRAFYECKALTSITLLQGVESIGNEAFAWCTALTSITLPQGVERIGHNPFTYCNNLSSVICRSPHFNVINKMLLTSDGKRLISYWGKEYVVSVPQGVESIGDGAFYECKSLKSITLPQGVESIGNEAFKFCKALTSITLPQGVKSIGNRAFYECKALKSITLLQGVESIGNEAFKFCKALASITLPQGVKSIGNNALLWCRASTGIRIPQGVLTEQLRPQRGRALTSIRIPKGTLAHFQRILPLNLHEKIREY